MPEIYFRIVENIKLMSVGYRPTISIYIYIYIYTHTAVLTPHKHTHKM